MVARLFLLIALCVVAGGAVQAADLAVGSFLGGSAEDYATAIALDSAGNIYIAGCTHSSNLPVTSGACDSLYNGGTWDVFVAKLDSTGKTLNYCTYIGGSDTDYPYGIAVDSSGCAYVTGYTISTNFPTVAGAYDATHNGVWDVFVFKLNADGSSLDYSTFLGGIGVEVGRGIAVDQSGCAYVAGYTDSNTFPTTPGAIRSSRVDIDGFITKLSPGGATLVYSTFYGGAGLDYIMGLALDPSSLSVCITGFTNSVDFPVSPGAADSTYGGSWDAFAARLGPTGGEVAFSTYIGATDSDIGRAIAADTAGAVYVAGKTNSRDFPVTDGAMQRTKSGSEDGFVMKITADGTSSAYSSYFGASKDDIVSGIAVDSIGRAYITGRSHSPDLKTTGA